MFKFIDLCNNYLDKILLSDLNLSLLLIKLSLTCANFAVTASNKVFSIILSPDRCNFDKTFRVVYITAIYLGKLLITDKFAIEF